MLSKATVPTYPRCMLVVRLITCVAMDRLTLFLNSLYQSYYFLIPQDAINDVEAFVHESFL